MLDVSILEEAIASNDAIKIANIMKQFNLKFENGLIKASELDITEYIGYWDRMQNTKKTTLNSTYGAMANEGSRFFDERIAQSTTLSGRSIVKHMNAKINEVITGLYDHVGESNIAGDTDSLIGKTNIISNNGDMTIEGLFSSCNQFWKDGDKEYAYDPQLKVVSYDPKTDQPYYGNIEYIYRHKVNKEKWEIEDEDGNYVVITGDHSIMVERDGKLIELKPAELIETDTLLSILDK